MKNGCKNKKKENDKIIEKMLYKIANSDVDDEVTRSAKAFVRKLEETKKLKNQKVKKKVKHTTKHIQSSNLTVERNTIDDFVRIVQKRNPSWTLNKAKEFSFTASPNDPEYKKIMQEL